MLILGLLGMHFDAAVVFVTSQTLLLKLAVAILCMPNLLKKPWTISNEDSTKIKPSSEIKQPFSIFEQRPGFFFR